MTILIRCSRWFKSSSSWPSVSNSNLRPWNDRKSGSTGTSRSSVAMSALRFSKREEGGGRQQRGGGWGGEDDARVAVDPPGESPLELVLAPRHRHERDVDGRH